jgi:hypothetical protein
VLVRRHSVRSISRSRAWSNVVAQSETLECGAWDESMGPACG